MAVNNGRVGETHDDCLTWHKWSQISVFSHELFAPFVRGRRCFSPELFLWFISGSSRFPRLNSFTHTQTAEDVEQQMVFAKYRNFKLQVRRKYFEVSLVSQNSSSSARLRSGKGCGFVKVSLEMLGEKSFLIYLSWRKVGDGKWRHSKQLKDFQLVWIEWDVMEKFCDWIEEVERFNWGLWTVMRRQMF